MLSALVKDDEISLYIEINFDVTKAAQIKAEKDAAMKKEAEQQPKKATRSSSMMFGVEQLSKVQNNANKVLNSDSKREVVTPSDIKTNFNDILPPPNTDIRQAKSTVINRRIFRYDDNKERGNYFLNF